MKLSALLLAVVAAQEEGEDRWSFYDYSMQADGKVGHAVSGVGTTGQGGHEGNRLYCHSTLDTKHIYRWDVTMNGYFAHFNPVECIGNELFCTIEERAHFGQIIGIRAGCAQMMNHPQVPTAAPQTYLTDRKKDWPNKESMRGATFPDGGTVQIYYGVGGCLALPAQNGYDVHQSTTAGELAIDFAGSLKNNYFSGTNGGYGMNQCLRFQRADGKANLLPFGVSVCRACCTATSNYYATTSVSASTGDGPCNFAPFASSTVVGKPHLTAALFDCTKADLTTCTFTASTGAASDCEICTKEMFPNFSMYLQPHFDYYSNMFQLDQAGAAFCAATFGAAGEPCTPEQARGQIAGG